MSLKGDLQSEFQSNFSVCSVWLQNASFILVAEYLLQEQRKYEACVSWGSLGCSMKGKTLGVCSWSNVVTGPKYRKLQKVNMQVG